MAVVQISKIQLRRGKKNSVSGIPQLASAEMAWAVDSQELYIGNGATSEGAPYVGNTRILTEHENLLGLISSYAYAADDPAMSQFTVGRSIQSKLDERVSVADFGIYPGPTSAEFFNTAMRELVTATDPTYRKVLVVPNGTYEIDGDLEIPSNVILEGETQTGVVLSIGEHSIRFITADGEFLNSGNAPFNVTISRLIIGRTTGQVILTGLKDSKFDHVVVTGDFSVATAIHDDSAALSTPAALYWDNSATETSVTGVTFNRCGFVGNTISVKAASTIANQTHIHFDECNFVDNYYGTIVDGISGQRTDWIYRNCTFDKIYNNAFNASAGKGTVIRNSTFIDVGNKGQGVALPQVPMVQFGERSGNIVVDCFGDRMQNANIVESANILAVPTVNGGDTVSFVDRIVTDFGLTDTPVPFAVLSTQSNTYTLDYVLRLGDIYRKGKLTIAVGNQTNPGNDDLTIDDEYTTSPNLSQSEAGLVITDFSFSVSIHDNNFDGTNDTIAILYQNNVFHQGEDSLATPGLTGDISFDVSYTN